MKYLDKKKVKDALTFLMSSRSIPLKNMNQLLEKLVQDFELVRDHYTLDANPTINRVKNNDIPTLTDEEYQLLTGIAFIRTPAETKEIAIGSSIQTVTTKYNWTYFRTLAKRDKAKYEFEIITRSRMIRRKLMEFSRKVDTDASLADKVSQLFKTSMLSNYSNSADDQTPIKGSYYLH